MRTVGGWHNAIATGEWRQAVVSSVAGVVGMVPEGLVLLTSLNFALAAIRLARKNTLVQDLDSVETLARVDALNLDKTGTITDGGIVYDDFIALPGCRNKQHAMQALYDLANEESPNGTGRAVLEGLGKQGFSGSAGLARVPFSSARKWSAVAFHDLPDEGQNGVWYMGAPEVLLSGFDGEYQQILAQVNEYANNGNRVLLIAHVPGGDVPADFETNPQLERTAVPVAIVLCSEHIRSDAEPTLRWFREQGVRCRVISGDNETNPQLERTAVPVAIVLCSEHIRSDAEPTLRWFREQGVRCRVISGDNPVTVGAIAAKVQLTGERKPVAMDARELPKNVDELARVLEGVDVLGRVPVTVGAIAAKVQLTGERKPVAMDARELPKNVDELARVLEGVDVLGRVLPEQKKAIVQALHTQDHVVAMTGDGVNDALAIKEADLGIAMGNAAPATKAVAEVVLVDSKFSHLPDVVARGRQVMANMERVASLFVTKTAYSALISLGVVLMGIPFPYLPRHISYIGALTIGAPAFFLALAPNTRRYIPGFLRRVVAFSVPCGIATGLSVLLSAWFIPRFMHWNVFTSEQQLFWYIGALTIGAPAFFLALAPNTRRYIPGFLRRVVAFSVPCGIATGLSVLLSAWFIPRFMHWNVFTSEQQLFWLRSMCATVLFLMGIYVLSRVSKPLNSWRGWLVLAFAAAGVIGACIPFIARFFAFGLPAGRAVWILLLQMAVATVLRRRRRDRRVHPVHCALLRIRAARGARGVDPVAADGRRHRAVRHQHLGVLALPAQVDAGGGPRDRD